MKLIFNKIHEFHKNGDNKQIMEASRSVFLIFKILNECQVVTHDLPTIITVLEIIEIQTKHGVNSKNTSGLMDRFIVKGLSLSNLRDGSL
jgi:hypothetical protein